MGLGTSMDDSRYYSPVYTNDYCNSGTTSKKEMTQEELSEKYMGKNIEIYASDDEEVVWMFNVRSVATVDTKEGYTFMGWLSADKTLFGTPREIEVYSDPKENDEVILRPEDKVTIFETPEKLQERVIEYLKKRLLCDPEKK